MRPDRAVVINLRRRPDRLKRFLAGWVAFGLPVDLLVLEATDPKVKSQPLSAMQMSAPAWGCWDSHVRALRQEHLVTLVLEDDAVFAPHFRSALDDLVLPPDWEMCQLGGQHLVPPEEVVPGLVRPRHTIRSHAYLAREPHELGRLLARCPRHVDMAFSKLSIRRYAVDPWLVGQDDSPGDISRQAPTQTEFWNEGERRGA
jgi:hypothetical protein